MTEVRSPAGDLRLGDPDTFAHGVPHDALAELRRTDPVAWQDLDGQAGFWAVLATPTW